MKVVIGFGMRGVLDTTPELAVTSGYTCNVADVRVGSVQ